MDSITPSSITSLLDDDTLTAIQQSVQDAINAQVDLMTRPMHPQWYKASDYPKPNPGKAYSHVLDIEGQFAPLRQQIATDMMRVGGEFSAVYKGFNKYEDEAWVDSGIQSEVELIAYQLADTELSFDAPATTIADEDESSRKIDFAIACYDDAEHQHMHAGNGPLRLDKARTLLTTGRLAWHATLNLDADEGEMPFNESLLDPATCYPVFESRRGMRSMARRYSTTVAEVIGSYSSADNELEYLVEERNKSGQFQKARKPTDVVVVSEYWDRRWRIVWMDGDVILGPVEHGFSFVPFVYRLGGLGLPAYQRNPSQFSETDLTSMSVGVTYNPRDVSHPNKGISLVNLLTRSHNLKEIIMSKLLNAFDTSIHPPMVMELDELTYRDGVPDVSVEKRAISPLKMGRQRLSPIPTDPSPQLMGPILNGMTENQSKLMLPPTAHGINDKSNVAGYATNVLNDAGLVKLTPHKMALEAFEQECMEMRFRMYRDYGHLVKQGDYGKQGELTVPHSDTEPGQPRAFTLTPTDLRQTGIKIKVSMSGIPVQMLGSVGNSVNQLVQAGLMDKTRALRILGDPNPHKTIRRIRYDAILNDPIIQQMEVIEGLRSEGLEEAAAYYMQQAGGQSQPASGGGMGAGMNEATQGSPVTATVGDSNAMYGHGPGPGSGPPGVLGPRTDGGMME